MQALIERLDESLKNAPTILKDDTTSTVARVNIDGKPIVIKRSNTKNAFHFIRRLFHWSRAKKNWDYAQRLHSLNISTFEPIAVVEERYGPLRGRSYFLCNYLEGVEALYFFAHGALPQPNWKEVATDIVILIKRLAKDNLYHQDLNLSNIILVNNKPFLIDLDSMRSYRFGWSTQRILEKLWRRFMENWDEMPGVSPLVGPLFQATYDELDNFKS